MRWIAPPTKDTVAADLEKRLWSAADELRANSGLTSAQYGQPVLGLIFLRFADAKFAARRQELEKAATGRRGSRVEPGQVGETLDVQYNNNSITGSSANQTTWSVALQDGWYNRGANTRHELGHLVNAAAHGRKQDVPGSCLSYARNLISANPGHSLQSCEHAYAATKEGIATFFGVRSIVTNESYDGAFFCFCQDLLDPSQNQGLCSAAAVATPFPSDRQNVCPGGGSNIAFSGVGDDFADDDAHCSALRTTGGNACNCPTDTGGDFCTATWRETHGYRNETNIVRFLWDAIDTNSDSGRPDDVNESVQGLVARFEAMTCTGTCDGGFASDCGVDGTCNEPNAAPCDPSIPSTPLTGYPAAMTGTRDAYNAWELRSHIVKGPHSDWEEARNNCVDKARD